ncbi:uncharacterized protein LOC144617882 [Crassostrea virginica]
MVGNNFLIGKKTPVAKSWMAIEIKCVYLSNLVCPAGRYGTNCAKTCGPNCLNCNRFNGVCEFGCLPEWTGTYCEKRQCDGHTYGLECNQSCECDGHTYGLGCKQSCGKCSGGVQCDHVTGSCPNGCDAGMYGDKCDIACGNYTYGVECKELCGNCSNGEPCHHVDGSCPSGCGIGVYGKTCDKACQPDRYGISCGETCRPYCQGCNRFNGACEFGCHPGWTGTFCEKSSNYVFR